MARKKYIVSVSYTQERDITVWADDDEHAADKACEIVESWEGVLSAEATAVEEDIE